MGTFESAAGSYKDNALVQQKAATRLIELLSFVPTDDILDVACGPGHITQWFSRHSLGKVVGIDASHGMIEKAGALYPSVEFHEGAAEDMAWGEAFDIVFCNSALQWFAKPEQAVCAMRRALRSGGKIGIACPGTAHWSPFFERVVLSLASHEDIGKIFSHWKNPWFMLPSENDYRAFFEKCGLVTRHLEVVHEQSFYSPDEAFNIYLSGAANGFAAKQYYDIPISDDYLVRFDAAVRAQVEKNAINGKVCVDFNRLYYVGTR